MKSTFEKSCSKILRAKILLNIHVRCAQELSAFSRSFLSKVMGVFFVLILLTYFRAQAQIITTIAGNGTLGNTGDGGSATNASLMYPDAVAVDHAGNVYIAVQVDRVRKVNTMGIISNFAGNGHGYNGDGIPATDADLYVPGGMAADSHDNIYIVDSRNYRIRKVDSLGIISTIAGTGVSNYSGDGGSATSAELLAPLGIAIDKNDNIYFNDCNNVRKISNSGVITTVAGNGYGCPASGGFLGDGGVATAAELHAPLSVAFGSYSDLPNLYIADNLNQRIRIVNPVGVINTFAGGGYSGTANGIAATAALLQSPTGIATDHEDNVYIVDEPNNCVRIVNTSGVINTFAGTYVQGFSGDGGPATAAQLSLPYSVAVDDWGNIYIDDLSNNRIRKVSINHTKVVPLFESESSQNIFPNPANNKVSISFATSQEAEVRICVTTATTQIVAMQNVHAIGGKMSISTFNTKDLPTGLYLYSICSNGQCLNGKITVIH